MATRKDKRLSAKQVASELPRGWYNDGYGLYLQVSEALTKSWVLRYKFQYRPRWMGLGRYPLVTLVEARNRADTARRLLLDGKDPLDQKNADKAAQALQRAKSITFDECATDYIKAHRAEWANAKHAEQWTNTLATYASPVIGKLAVLDVDTGLIVRVLKPIWSTKSETARRLRARIESVLDSAATLGYRGGENPARWRGHLEHLLPKLNKAAKVEHHPALPFTEVPAFLVEIRKREGVAAKALEFAILTAARTGEVIGAVPGEFDLDAAVWTIPASRMKGKREHKVPLVPRAVEIVRELIDAGNAYVFPGPKPGSALSNMAMLSLLERMGRDDITVHGFRSSFRDWASERTSYPREVIEMALAHAIGDRVEAAYRRGDLLGKRCALMQDWSRHCENITTGKVVPIGRAG